MSASKDNRQPTDPDYPPAVLKEAEEAAKAAGDRAGTFYEDVWRAAADAYAAVLARHTVAARLAAENPEHPSGAFLSTSSDPGQFSTALARLATREAERLGAEASREPYAAAMRAAEAAEVPPAYAPLLAGDEGAALREPAPVLVDLPIGYGGTHTRTVEARTEIARLTAALVALAARHAVLRGTLRGLAICGLEAVQEIAANALADDDKAAQS